MLRKENFHRKEEYMCETLTILISYSLDSNTVYSGRKNILNGWSLEATEIKACFSFSNWFCKYRTVWFQSGPFVWNDTQMANRKITGKSQRRWISFILINISHFYENWLFLSPLVKRETIQSLFLFLPPPFKFYKCKFKIWADLKMDYKENALA